MPSAGPSVGPFGYRYRSENTYDSEALVDFLINLFYALAANLYLGSSDGSSSGGGQ
ncbi:hypothetical protein [Rhodococcus sp. (in: high G+C Gram-positive bacteria)]|uniref:hypothetical protein n=1 Tax=Rhodococcus sp. TaxID=1831 RepID=UPI003B8A8DE3